MKIFTITSEIDGKFDAMKMRDFEHDVELCRTRYVGKVHDAPIPETWFVQSSVLSIGKDWYEHRVTLTAIVA